MAEPTEWTDSEKRIAEALRNEPAAWTQDCLDPDDLIGLIERGGNYPNASRLLAHVAACASCRREYGEMRKTLQLAARARELQAIPRWRSLLYLLPFARRVNSRLHTAKPAFAGSKVESAQADFAMGSRKFIRPAV